MARRTLIAGPVPDSPFMRRPSYCTRLTTPMSRTSGPGSARPCFRALRRSRALWIDLFLRLPGPLLRWPVCRLLGSPALRLRRLRLLL